MPTHENASETEQAPTQVAARSLLLQLILLLSLLYLAVLCKVDLVLGLSLACTAACAIIAWQRPSKVCYFPLLNAHT